MTAMLTGKVVAITGASSGIGRGTAIAAARHGARAVIVADIAPDPREGGEPTAELVSRAGCVARYHHTDVTRRSSIDAMVDATEDLGGIDLMVCNAGIGLEDDTVDISEADFHKVLSVNLDGALFSAQAAANQMRRLRKQGSIVFVSSMGGMRGSGFTVAYCTSKGGVRLLAASMADGLGPHGIRVNSVCPGLIDTHMLRSSAIVSEAARVMTERMPLRRLAEPEEVGDVIAWLGSDYASYVTGVSLPVDGGLTAVV